MNFEPGTEFAQRYRILNVVGRGGAGTILKAEDSRLSRIVAIKVFDQAATGQPELAEQVFREANVLGRLNHPAIIRLYDSGMCQDTPYLVMEYVERSLADILRQGRQRPEYAVAIISPIADALAYAHSKGIVHRDIKPSNILISSDGRVLLSDFGLALPSGLSSLISTGYVLGTPTYVSPEQAKGLPLDARSDIYSLAVVLFELLVGRPPFLGSSPAEIIAQHVESPVPVELLRLLPNAHLESVLVKALSKRPGDRYSTIQEFVADLRQALDRDRLPVVPSPLQGQQAGPVPSPMRMDAATDSDIRSRPARRLRWPIVVGGASLFVLMTIVALVSLQGVFAPPLLTATTPPLSPTMTPPATTTPTAPPAFTKLLHEMRSAGLFVVLLVIVGLSVFWIMTKRPRRHSTMGFPPCAEEPFTKEHPASPRPMARPCPPSSPASWDDVEYTESYSGPDESAGQDSTQEEGSSPFAPFGSTASSDRADQTAPFARYPSSPMPSTRILEQQRPALALAWLVPITGPNAGQPFRLSNDPVSIGRGTECDVCIDDFTVSRNHARIKFENGRFYLYDLGSSNGTFANGELVQRHELRDRDEIAIGETSFIFKEVATPDDLTADARRRLREFEALWHEVARAVRHD